MCLHHDHDHLHLHLLSGARSCCFLVSEGLPSIRGLTLRDGDALKWYPTRLGRAVLPGVSLGGPYDPAASGGGVFIFIVNVLAVESR